MRLSVTGALHHLAPGTQRQGDYLLPVHFYLTPATAHLLHFTSSLDSVPTFTVLEPVLGVSCAARAAHAEQQQGEEERGGCPHQHPHHHRHARHLLHRHLATHRRVARGAAVLVVRGAAAEGLPPDARASNEGYARHFQSGKSPSRSLRKSSYGLGLKLYLAPASGQ